MRRPCRALARISLAALLLLTPACAHADPITDGPPPNDPADKLPQVRGFSMQLNDPAGTANYLKAIDDMAALGCTWINFAVAARVSDVHSNTVYMDWRNLPTMHQLETILKHAQEKHIHTMLMPIVLLDKANQKEWRGVIAPPDWDQWFFTYDIYLTQMATLSRRCDVDILCVGSELLSTESKRSHWLKVISDIREKFPGKLTYSANWDHYTVPSFWDHLDYIGMNNYNELADEPGASVPDLVKAWQPIKRNILAFAKQQNKPFMFTETGWHNLKNTIAEPWNYVATGDIDTSEQLHAYESFVDVWTNVTTDKFMGAFIWEWKPGADGVHDHGAYSLQGTPAMDVVKKWMAGPKPVEK
jgi:hypothetical protein